MALPILKKDRNYKFYRIVCISIFICNFFLLASYLLEMYKQFVVTCFIIFLIFCILYCIMYYILHIILYYIIFCLF